MKIKKTVGFRSDGEFRKSYTIHTECGLLFIARANGRNAGYRCEGLFYSSIKEIKAEIEADKIFKALVRKDERVADDGNKSPMWDCIDPCALLVHLRPFVPSNSIFSKQSELMETLDNHGWLDDNGKPDEERAEKEFKRVYGQ